MNEVSLACQAACSAAIIDQQSLADQYNWLCLMMPKLDRIVVAIA